MLGAILSILITNLTLSDQYNNTQIKEAESRDRLYYDEIPKLIEELEELLPKGSHKDRAVLSEAIGVSRAKGNLPSRYLENLKSELESTINKLKNKGDKK